MEDAQPDLAEAHLATLGEVHRGDGRHDVERGPQRLRVAQPIGVERMDRDVGAGVRGDRGVVADVVPVPVGADDELQRPVAGGQLVGDPGQRRRRGVDGDGLAGPLVGQDVDVRGDRADDPVEVLHPGIVAHGALARLGARLVDTETAERFDASMRSHT